MADNYGLLAGLAQGLDKGIQSYQAESERLRKVKKEETEEARKLQEMEEERAYKKGMLKNTEMNTQKGLLSEGLRADEYGNIVDDPSSVGYQVKKAKIAESYSKAAGGGSGKAPTDSQSSAAGYARRLQQSEQIFNDLENKGYNFGSRVEDAKGLLPGEFQSDEFRAKEQAENNFINAVLRRESGASISHAERQSAAQQYFVRPGDPDSVKAQKRANRQQVIENLKGASGHALGLIPLVPTGTSAAPTKGMLGKVKVSNGKETLMIDPSDLEAALKDGYKRQ